MQFQNEDLQRRKKYHMTKPTKIGGGEGGAVDMETESYEYETIFQIS